MVSRNLSVMPSSNLEGQERVFRRFWSLLICMRDGRRRRRCVRRCRCLSSRCRCRGARLWHQRCGRIIPRCNPIQRFFAMNQPPKMISSPAPTQRRTKRTASPLPSAPGPRASPHTAPSTCGSSHVSAAAAPGCGARV